MYYDVQGSTRKRRGILSSHSVIVRGGHQRPQVVNRNEIPMAAESDSVNENFHHQSSRPCSTSARPNTKRMRKRKFKRMAIDPSSSSTHQANTSSSSLMAATVITKKPKVRSRHHSQQQAMAFVCSGKRKRSNREKSVETDHMTANAAASSTQPCSSRRLAASYLASRIRHRSGGIGSGERMDCDDDKEDNRYVQH